MYDSVLKEFDKIVSLCWGIKHSCRVTILEELKVKQFVKYVLKNSPKFTAASFFGVGRWTILSFLTIYVDFLIVVVQLTKP